LNQWKSVDDVIAFAIGEEQTAADFYARLARQARTPGMKQALEGFAREEMGHKARLEAIRAGTEFKPRFGQVTDLKIADYLVEVSPDADLDYRSALIVAMKKEEAARKLYLDMAGSVADNQLKEVFQALALEEAAHKLRFEAEYDDMIASEG